MRGVAEWKDLRIDIKVCGKDVPEEEQAFVQFYPKVSQRKFKENS
jgi:hypothetical protein